MLLGAAADPKPGSVEDGWRKVARLNDPAAGEDDGSFDHILELTHIARKRIAAEEFDRLRAEAGDLAVVFATLEAKEVLREGGDVRGPVAQRRQLDRHDIDAVVEVLTELTGCDELFKRLVAREDDPDIDFDRFG
jgi:hypothetical protein